MNTNGPENEIGVAHFHFNCPHCKGLIRFAVEAASLDVDLDDEDDYDDDIDSPYFYTMEEMQVAISSGDYENAVPLIQENFQQLVNLPEDQQFVYDGQPPVLD